MNKIILKGMMRNIEYSHTINDVEYNKADLVVSEDNRDDVISIRFKKFSNPYSNGDNVELLGNIRSYSQMLENGKSKVSLYVFTYFDIPINEVSEEFTELKNHFEIDGRVCKMNELRTTAQGKHNLHFTLANNIITSNNSLKLNNYCPVVCWGNLAKEFKDLKVNDKILIKGRLHSRTYRKQLDNGEIEFRVAHELVASDIIRLDD